VLRKDKTPDSYWVRLGLSELRRNRKHLFLLNKACLDEPDEVLPRNYVTNDQIADADNEEFANNEFADDEFAEEELTDNEEDPDTNPVIDNDASDTAVEAPMGVESTVPSQEEATPSGATGVETDGDAFAPMRDKQTVTRSGRVVKPPKSKDIIYYQ
jgi:hypothetical protein